MTIAISSGRYFRDARQNKFFFNQINSQLSVKAIFGITVSREGERFLLELADLDISDESCRRLTESIGAQLLDQPLPTLAQPPQWDFTIPASDAAPDPASVAYVGIDAFSGPLVGSPRRGAEMLYVGLLYDPRKEHTVYLVHPNHDETLAQQLRAAAIPFGVGETPLIGLSDAGQGLERVLTQRGGGARNDCRFLACRRTLTHGGELLAWPGSAEAQDWVHRAKGVLRLQGGVALREWLRTHGPGSEVVAVQTAWHDLEGYLTNHHARMDYPRYDALGWDIGSGPTEAGCKLLGQRSKGTGMKWLSANVAAVLRLRALYQSGEGLWERLFETSPPPLAA